MATVTATIGSGPITLVQANTMTAGYTGVVNANGQSVTISYPTQSTAGTALVAIAGGSGLTLGPSVVAFPTGWTRLLKKTESFNSDFEIWSYLNNPGGISAVSFTVAFQLLPGTAEWFLQVSEWANVATTAALDTSGSASATSGTTLTPITGSVSGIGDVAVGAWVQFLAAPGVVTFSSPQGWTRLADNTIGGTSGHLDVEYLIGPASGVPLSPTFSSNGTTNTAAGGIVVLKSAPPAVTVTAFIENEGVIIKQNTADITLMLGGKLLLEDGSGYYLLEDSSGDYLLDTYVPQLGDPVTVTISP